MPVIYSTATGLKGFQPCSRAYRRTLLQALRQHDFVTVQELFQQAHKLVWMPSQVNDPRTGHPMVVYKHRLAPHLTLTPVEYMHLSTLPGNAITETMINQQCGIIPGAAAGVRTRAPKASPFVGPQLGIVRRALNRMQRVQDQSYEAANRAGYPVQGFKGLALYAPSPFLQQRNAAGDYEPFNPGHVAGGSGGPCRPNGECDAGLECRDNVCVVPVAQRQCPPFQFPVELDDPQGRFRVSNPSKQRTRKVTKYSPVVNRWFETCLPGDDSTVQRWIENPRLRQYLGLVPDVVQIPETEWRRQSQSQQIHTDPATNAPYFLRAPEPAPEPGSGSGINQGQPVRVYKLNSAYSPSILFNNAVVPPVALQVPPPASSQPPRAVVVAPGNEQEEPENEDDLERLAMQMLAGPRSR